MYLIMHIIMETVSGREFNGQQEKIFLFSHLLKWHAGDMRHSVHIRNYTYLLMSEEKLNQMKLYCDWPNI